jgi:hypothetical protein
MYQHSDLEVVKLHFQELRAEADRNRLIKQSGLWEERGKNRWYLHLLTVIGAWLAKWSCILQSQLSKNLFPGIHRMAVIQDPCLCATQPCTE